jgi:hypothetical protein
MLTMMKKMGYQMVQKSLMDQMALLVQVSETGLMRQFVTQELAQEKGDQLIRLGDGDGQRDQVSFEDRSEWRRKGRHLTLKELEDRLASSGQGE